MRRWRFGLIAGMLCVPSLSILGQEGTGGVKLIALALLWAWWAPVLLALYTDHPRTGRIALLSLLGGWTILGWLIALVWALRSR